MDSNGISCLIDGVQPTFIWFRKNFREEYLEGVEEYLTLTTSEKKFVRREWRKIFDNLRFIVEEMKVPNLGLSKFMTPSNVNKLEVLYHAKKVGLNIPKSYLTNNFELLESHISWITKPVGEFSFLENKANIRGPYTTKISKKECLDFNCSSISFFQEMITNLGDVRVFYLAGSLYAGVIHKDTKSSSDIDFRINSSADEDLFWKNYIIPTETKEKVNLLMKGLQMNFGILDFILTDLNNLIFLEVNVGGQFGDLGFECNFNFEKIISKYIMLKNN